MDELRWCSDCAQETVFDVVGDLVEGLAPAERACADCGSAIWVASFEAELIDLRESPAAARAA